MEFAQLVEFEDKDNEYLQANASKILNSDRSFTHVPDDRHL